jgi:hypothetical protein
MSRSICLLIITLGLIAPLAGHAANAYQDRAEQFVQERLGDVRILLQGPDAPPPAQAVPAGQTCEALYYQRVALLAQNYDRKPAYWDDPRNRGAVFIGTMFTPAFYYLGYTSLTRYLEDARAVDARPALDALRLASAAQRCFLR